MAKRRFWELLAEGEWRKLRISAALCLLSIGNVAMGVVNVREEFKPRYAVRTDLMGHSDVILLDETAPLREAEVLEFVKEWSFHAFSWTPSTAAADRAFIESRVDGSVARVLAHAIPGYELALKADPGKGLAPRVSMRIEGNPVVFVEGERATVQLHLALNFWQTERLPADPGVLDPVDKEWHHYGFVLSARRIGRTLENPFGLVVSDLRRVQLSEIRS